MGKEHGYIKLFIMAMNNNKWEKIKGKSGDQNQVAKHGQ